MIEAGYMTGTETGEKLAWLEKVVATAQTQVEYGAPDSSGSRFVFSR